MTNTTTLDQRARALRRREAALLAELLALSDTIDRLERQPRSVIVDRRIAWAEQRCVALQTAMAALDRDREELGDRGRVTLAWREAY